MANEQQLSILKQGVEVWNEWRVQHPNAYVDFRDAYFETNDFVKADLIGVDLRGAFLMKPNLRESKLDDADLRGAYLSGADLTMAALSNANLTGAVLEGAYLSGANLSEADLSDANFILAHFRLNNLRGSKFFRTKLGDTTIGASNLSSPLGLESVIHDGPSEISTDTFLLSRGNIPEIFLRGCGLSDWEIEVVKLYHRQLSNEERNKILYKIYDLQASQAIQISPLFISYSQNDGVFVDRLENQLKKNGIRFWRDIHDMKSGRIEKQIDRAIRQNPTVLLVLSEHSLSSDWVEHEVRTARGLEKEMGRDVLCPLALDDSWKNSRWPKRLMQQIMEYNILDFSEWQDNVKFEGMFRRLIDGLELFYKG
jgi:uncharacterized protein YjbI with pentapeptide repeats